MDHKLGYMFTNWYSGATLFAILLNNHPSITCNGETFPFSAGAIERYICSCGEPLLRCEYYRDVCSHMLVDGGTSWNEDLFVALPRFSGNAAVNQLLNGIRYPSALRRWLAGAVPSWRRLTREFVEAHHTFYQSCCRREGSLLYIDGTKSIRRAELTLRGVRPAPRVIHLVRDGRGFCASYIKHEGLGVDGLPRAAQAWNRHIRFVETFHRRHPGIERLTVRYEDLCRDQSGVMERICGFFGIDGSMPYAYRQGVEHHILGNKMRKTWDGKVTEDLSWRTKLTGENIRVITAIMEQNLAACGYL
jgi:hypothetical protein